MDSRSRTLPSWTCLRPPIVDQGRSQSAWLAYARLLSRAQRALPTSQDIEHVRTSFVSQIERFSRKDRARLLAAGLVLRDLAMQGWHVRVRRKAVEVSPPTVVADHHAEKARIRQQELLKRDAQLAEPSTREFVASMEQARLFGNEFVSIFSLMRDGRELAAALREARDHNNNGWADALQRAVDPYLQFVSPESRCQFTGFRLIEVWRYFRHTWTNQYATVPGRSMAFLVRDRAARFHPVVGIGALSSPIMQIRERDKWIGWHPETFLEDIRVQPTNQGARWLVQRLAAAIDEIYVEDFIEEGIITTRDLSEPSLHCIKRLSTEGVRQRKRHHRYARSLEHKKKGSGDDHWINRARTHLFRSKRAIALADFLSIRATFGHRFIGRPTGKQLAKLLETNSGKRAVQKIVRKVKADRIGIAVADISVCGAIQPYNAILGGKLVSMLAASSEVVHEYRRRYSRAQSEIASAMAGRAIIRPPNLVLLGTTSLYGVGSSQYNRIKIPCARLGGLNNECIRYEELGRSQSFGTSQYAEDTVRALVELVQQSKEGQRVNSIFGEGISPKLRKIRDGLDLLNFPSNELLRHHRQRVVYGIPLIRNLRTYLLGMARRPEYLFAENQPRNVTAAIAAWWRERWLRGRIQNEAVLEEVAKHTHIRPIHHGARVRSRDHSKTPDNGSTIPTNRLGSRAA